MLEYIQRVDAIDVEVLLGIQVVTLVAYEAMKWLCRAAWRRDKRGR